jgi:hypothetical protein
MERKELDGLSKSHPQRNHDGESQIHDPNKDLGLLVEWSVSADLRNDAIKEVYDVITAGEHLSEAVDSGEITEEDISMSVSGL